MASTNSPFDDFVDNVPTKRKSLQKQNSESVNIIAESTDISTYDSTERDSLLDSRRPSGDVSPAKPSIKFTFKQKAILMGALFMKGGIGGAYAPFFTLWLHVHSYTASEVGIIALIDIVFSILLMPIIGMYLDKWHYHNKGLCLIMASV